MSAPIPLLLALLGLVASARIRLTAVLFGQPVSVPVLGLVAVVVVLVLAVLVLWLLRAILRDGLRLRPRMVTP
jgi:ABC-type Mn2+/Zn2+ transport system permease subunit